MRLFRTKKEKKRRKYAKLHRPRKEVVLEKRRVTSRARREVP